MFFKKSSKKQIPKDPILAKQFNYEEGMETVRSFIAPSAIQFTPNYTRVGEVFSRTLFVTAYPKYLSTGWFSPIINIDFSMDISMFSSPMNTVEILKKLRNTAAQLNSQIHLEREGGQVRDPVKEAALENVERLRDGLQEGTERFFRFGLYVTLYGETKARLDEITRQLEAILEAQMVYVKPAVLRMNQGFLLFTLEKYFHTWAILLQFLCFLAFLILVGDFDWDMAIFVYSALFAGVISQISRSFLFAFLFTWIFGILSDIVLLRFF